MSLPAIWIAAGQCSLQIFQRLGIVASVGYLLTTLLSAQGLSPATPAKEYIRLNGQVIAIENAAGTSGTDAPFGVIEFPSGVNTTTPLSGTLAFLGWAASNVAEIDHVALSIDGGASFSGTAQYGIARTDVCQVFS
jgi:hypothetical protein